MNNESIAVVTVTLNPAIDQSLIIPNFSTGSVNRVESPHAKAGGKGVNVAAALAGYGHRAAATGFLGSENTTLFENLFSDQGIADHFIRIKGETRTGIKIFDPVSGQTTDINFPGLTPTAADFESLVKILQTLTTEFHPWFVLAGSLPPGIDPVFYRDLILTLKSGGCRIMLDTSGEALKHALDAAPHIVKPNVHELEMLFERELPTDKAIIEAAHALLAKGVELAVISMGGRGALFITGDEVISAGPPEVKIGSSVGSTINVRK